MIDQVTGVDMLSFPAHGDENGSLIALETGKDICFPIKRVYYIYGTRRDVIRGKHAHRNINQVLICVNGQCDIELYDGTHETTVRLDSPDKGIYISGYIWREMKNFSDESVLLVLVDSLYSETEYIYDKDELKG